MPLELHVWGPAFSLPSIDPQCLAAIAYFTQAVPKGEWVLVASSETASSPTHNLPALRNGDTWIGGLRNIIDYVKQISDGMWNLDADLDEGEQADVTAFSAFIEAQGQDLLDLSLYVSSDNWITTVRPAYSKILPLPLPYIIPPSLRNAAKTRTEHLGLSSLDIDSADESQSQRPDQASIIPASLRRPNVTVSSLLHQSPAQASKIRLDSLAIAFLAPLQAFRGKDRFFLSSLPTSLDCLALGYLSLALLPDVPSSWLADSMRAKFPQLCAFVHDAQRTFYGGSVSLEDAYLSTSSSIFSSQSAIEEERVKRAQGKAFLPWIAPSHSGSVFNLAKATFSSVLDSLPIISSFRSQARLRDALNAEAETDDDRKQVAALTTLQRRELITTLVTCAAAVGLFVGFVIKCGVVQNIQEIWDLAAAQRELEGIQNLNDKLTKDGANLLGVMVDAEAERGAISRDGFSDEEEALMGLGRWMDVDIGMGGPGPATAAGGGGGMPAGNPQGEMRGNGSSGSEFPVVEVDVQVAPDGVVSDRVL